MRLFSFIAASCVAAAPWLAAQPALSYNEIARGVTCLSPVEVRSVPVEPAKDIVIAVLMDTLRDEEWTRFREEFTAYYQAAPSKESLRLAVVAKGSVQFSGPFRTRPLLKTALDELSPAAPSSADTADPLRFYPDLATTTAQLGAGWSTVVLAGNFPGVPAELSAYTQALLSAQLRTARVRVDYWTPSDEAAAVLDAAIPSVAGKRLANGFVEVLEPASSGEFREVSWENPAPPREDFRLCSTTLLGSDGEPSIAIPTILTAPGVAAPSIGRFATWQEKVKSVAGALRQPQISDADAIQADADLTLALEINPRVEDVIKMGAELYRKLGKDSKLAPMLDALAETNPEDAGLFTELGHVRYRMQDWDAADRALLRSRELKPGDASVSEELFRIRLARGDDRGTLPFLEERLATGPTTQDLWLLRADLATRLNDWERIADSVEHSISLGNVALDRRTGLVRLYLQHQLPEKALIHVRAVAGELPADPAVREEYARFLDDLQQPQEALAAWRRTLEVNPQFEPAHYRVTRILADANSLREALQSADAGIEAAPGSARLYVAKSELQEKLNQFYDARRTLRQAAGSITDGPLLARLAEIEDRGGTDAAAYYQRMVETFGLSADPAQRTAALQHGLDAALRDGDTARAAWFQGRLSPDAATRVTARSRTGTTMIPGGLDALGFVARSRSSSPDRFLVEYARTVVRNLTSTGKEAAENYVSAIRDHFDRVTELAALGVRNGDRVTVTLDVRDRNAQRNAEKILSLLGWKMQTSRQGLKVTPADKGSRAERHETASALAINEIGMQESLEAGKPFSFDIPYEGATVVLGEEAWRTQFYAGKKYLGGLAEAIVNDLELAEIYVGLAQMDAGTAENLSSGVGLKKLADDYAVQLMRFSSVMAVENGKVAVPGGTAAAPLWNTLVHANPDQPGRFFRELLSRDSGRLLAFYGALGTLDIRHQRFFTRSPARLGKFYDLFKDAPETQNTANRFVQAGTFVEFLAELPLDAEGNIDFPGSPEVWMVAKGQSPSVARLMKKVKKAAAPEVEDEILMRLARTKYKGVRGEHSELDNFLAVVHIDSHRKDPMDEASALTLAQHFDEYEPAYPYFAALTGLEQKHFDQFFAMSEKLRSLDDPDKNAAIASVNSLIKILCLASQAGALSEEQAAELFGKITQRFQQTPSVAAQTIASIELSREILDQAHGPKGDPDAALRSMLLGPDSPGQVILGRTVSLDSGKLRRSQYEQVLELQKVPSLATIFALFDAARELGAGKGDPSGLISVLESKAPGLFAIEVPKTKGVKDKEREAIVGFDLRRLQEIVKDLREKTAKKKVNPKDLGKLSQQYLEEMNAPARWALEGIVYAYYLSPEDLLVAEDPLLLRKHKFGVAPGGMLKARVHEPAEVTVSSDGTGSFFSGGFASFGNAAGRAAALSAKLGGDHAEAIAGKQMAALRATDWSKLQDEDLRLLSLKVAVAREWIVNAAGRPDLEAALAESSLGLLSLTRRATLSAALNSRDWTGVWSCVTLSDLYFLGDRYLERYKADPWQSPATRALREITTHNDGSRLAWLGAEFDELFLCSHPHLRTAPPYEDLEKEIRPDKLAERSAEFKLYLAQAVDRAGIPASAMGSLAEPAARVVLKRLQLADMYDWRSTLAVFASLDANILQEVLPKQ